MYVAYRILILSPLYRHAPFRYEIGPLSERTLEVFVEGDGYKPVPNMDTLLELLSNTAVSIHALVLMAR